MANPIIERLTVEPIQQALAAGAGALVGFALALVGGGGSILAVPLMIYLVGVSPPHIAIGTSALAVAVNALTGLVSHARAGRVKWRCGGMFALAGVAGALASSTLGKALDADRLLFLFALLMIAVGVLMLRKHGKPEVPDVRCDRTNAPRVIGFGVGAGAFAGFFGIGGGFLVVCRIGAGGVAAGHVVHRRRCARGNRWLRARGPARCARCAAAALRPAHLRDRGLYALGNGARIRRMR